MRTNKGVGLPAMRKTDQMIEIERQLGGRDIRLILADLWSVHGSQSKIAEMLGIDQSTVSMWAMRCGMELTTRPVALLAGKNLLAE